MALHKSEVQSLDPEITLAQRSCVKMLGSRMVKGTRSKMVVGPFQTFYLQTLEGQPFQTLSSWGDAQSMIIHGSRIQVAGVDTAPMCS